MNVEAEPEIHRGEIGRIPVLWADAPPPHEIQLVFRVGHADETLATAGVTHLVEHLAMPELPVRLECNAFVTNLSTCFWARGEMPLLVSFVAGVVDRLDDLPVERLEVERRILLAEAGQRAMPGEHWVAGRRFGAVGHGLSAFPELGLRRLTADMAREWARERFTVENAALWARGPLADLALSLPHGRRHRIPDVRSVPGVETPVYVGWDASSVYVSLLVPHGPESALVARVLNERLLRRLRHELGLVYSAGSELGSVDGTTWSLGLYADCPVEEAAKVRDGMVAVVDELVAGALTDDELEADERARNAIAMDPSRLSETLYLHAWDALAGYPAGLEAELAARVAAGNPIRAVESLREAWPSAVLALPGDLEAGDDRFRAYPATPATNAVTGKEFRIRGAWLGTGRRVRMVVGANGVTLVHADETSTTVRWETCAAVMAFRDGVRVLWGESGFILPVWPRFWRNGEKATRLVDELAPADVVVDMGDEPSPQPG
jgi:predicted Zn-dependent peptidase